MNTTTQDSKVEHEQYVFTDAKVIHKVDKMGKPDLKGMEYHLIDELEDGYMVYAKPGVINSIVRWDPSQPTASYFIHKRYFIS